MVERIWDGQCLASENETLRCRLAELEVENAQLLRQVAEQQAQLTVLAAAEQRLREAATATTAEHEARYRGLFENINVGVAVYEVIDGGKDFIFRDFNNAAERIDRDHRERLIGQSIFAMRPGVEEFGLIEVFRRVWETGAPEHHPVRLYQDGNLVGWYDNFIYKLRSGELVAVFENVTERKQMEEKLAENEWRYRSLFETTNDSVFIVNKETLDILDVNAAACRLYGYSKEELCRMKTLDVSAEPEESKKAVRNENSHIPVRYHRKKDGTVFPVEITGGYFGERDELYHTAVVRDITERMKLEAEREKLRAELFHAQKMEAIGTLAGGVAHDFNNILAGVLSGLSFFELTLGENPEHQGNLQDMKALVRRGADLAKQLLGFGCRGKYDPKPLDLAVVAEKTCSMFGRTRPDITVQYDFAPDLQNVLMDYAQLEQVLLNLFLNAGQAMPEGGRLMVHAENTSLSREQTDPHGATPGRFVELVVADTGIGMDRATQARIFEPFFTTKAAGQGSGLGLASVYGIMKNHGGIITVESEPANGTAFRIFLPATDKPSAKAEVPGVIRHVGRGTVLVVDDEVQLLRIYARMLSSIGYEVLTANKGAEAVDLVREHRDRISCVILDLTMPEMGGSRTFDALREVAPELKVLLASGFSVEGQPQELLARGCNDFIQKPFDQGTLAQKLQELIG